MTEVLTIATMVIILQYKNVSNQHVIQLKFTMLCQICASQVALVVKNPPSNVGDVRYVGLTLGREDPLDGNPFQ